MGLFVLAIDQDLAYRLSGMETKLKLERICSSPILQPKASNVWEAGAVFNAGAIDHEDGVHLIYKAAYIKSNGKEGEYVNNLGYAYGNDKLLVYYGGADTAIGVAAVGTRELKIV